MAILTRSKTQTPIIKTLTLYFFNTLLPNFSNFCNINQRVSKIITDTIRYSQTHLVPSFHTANIQISTEIPISNYSKKHPSKQSNTSFIPPHIITTSPLHLKADLNPITFPSNLQLFSRLIQFGYFKYHLRTGNHTKYTQFRSIFNLQSCSKICLKYLLET